jgi:hypothetical protein
MSAVRFMAVMPGTYTVVDAETGERFGQVSRQRQTLGGGRWRYFGSGVQGEAMTREQAAETLRAAAEARR